VKQVAEDDFEDRFEIRLAQAANRMFTRIYHHTTVLSPPRLPRKGPAILVCNHVSGLDPLLVQSACPRMIIWLMAGEYYDITGLSWFFKMVEAIPVQRSGRDATATRAALRALARGHVLGVFPEGRIETDHELLPFQTGVAMMSIKTGVDVYPAYLDGTQRGKEMLDAFVHPNQVRISFGKPMSFGRSGTSKEELEFHTAQIQQAVLSLRLNAGQGKMSC
jgi:1-acyl-sn-glycerol-3-phosphate acyltransferase